MDILQIIADGNPGGGTTHVLSILKRLSSEFQFSLITQENSYLYQQALQLGIPCFGIDFFTSRLDLRIPRYLHKILRKAQPELVHVHGARAGWSFALTKPTIPYIYSVHGYHFLHQSIIHQYASIPAERFISHRATGIIFESGFDRDIAVRHRFLSPTIWVKVIPNGIELTEIGVKRPQTKHIGFVGRLVRQKDPLLFLKVTNLLPGYQIDMIGGGELEAAVCKEIASKGMTHIHLHGVMSHQQVLNTLGNFRVLVMTSRWEGLPFLPMEAMWRGVPVVATNVGAISEIIEDRVSGILVNSRSPDEIAQAVREIEMDGPLRNKIIELAKQRIGELFSEEGMVKSIRAAYENALKEAHH